MCGEIDEQVLIGQEVLDRARVLAARLRIEPATGDGDDPTGLAEPEGRAAYMDRVFRSGLARALDDIARAEEDETVDALAAQAIALARLAGYLAGQLPPEADLFRATIEALTTGHAEPRAAFEAMQDHHHHHHHHHDHDHSHEHH
jgi:hypothetical protein